MLNEIATLVERFDQICATGTARLPVMTVRQWRQDACFETEESAAGKVEAGVGIEPAYAELQSAA